MLHGSIDIGIPRPMRSNATPCRRQVSWLAGLRNRPAFPGA